MATNGHLPMKDMEVYKLYVSLADEIWQVVVNWGYFEKKTVGAQLAEAADSIGANLVEGDARYGSADPLRFFIYARGSAAETEYWLERAATRNLTSAEAADDFLSRLVIANKLLNRLIAYRRRAATTLN
jgi:four helix bundle protein